jgi:hypothetical protein
VGGNSRWRLAGEIPDEWECQREASGISPPARINDDPGHVTMQGALHLAARTPF